MKAFLCHSSADSEIVVRVGAYLKRHLDSVFMYEDNQRSGTFTDRIDHALHECDVMVIFHRGSVTRYQKMEIDAVKVEIGNETKHWKIFIVPLPNETLKRPDLPEELMTLAAQMQIWPDVLGREQCYSPGIVTEGAQATNHLPSGYAALVAKAIVGGLQIPWHSDDDLPANPHLFDYEKDIIDFYTKKRALGQSLWQASGSDSIANTANVIRGILLDGASPEWPSTTCILEGSGKPNPLKDAGQPGGAKVVAAALSSYHGAYDSLGHHDWCADKCMLSQGFAFDEARPRATLHFPSGQDRSLRVAILVSGGIAPGINAVIDGIVQRHWNYLASTNFAYSLAIYGLVNGFHAFDVPIPPSHTLAEYNAEKRRIVVEPKESTVHANNGGAFLGTSRAKSLMDEATRAKELARIVGHLHDTGVNILYVIGGDGSMKAAHALCSTAKCMGISLSVIAIPKTMDNDILWMWQSFGFLSAVEKGREIVELLHTEVASNPRLCVVQLFGSDSGFVVSHAVLASATGQCDAALIPEVPFTMERLAKHMKDRMEERTPIPHGLVVMAETAIPLDAEIYADQKDIGLSSDEKKAIKKFCDMRRAKRRIEGQTDDDLRSAGLKIVGRGLLRRLREEPGVPVSWVNDLRVVASEPRHVLRSIRPSCADIIMGQRLGTLAVDNAMAGYTDFMISQWLTEYVLVPLKLVVLGRKRIPNRGIFWTSVRAKTGQEPRMYDEADLRKHDPRTYEDELRRAADENTTTPKDNANQRPNRTVAPRGRGATSG